MKKYLIDILQKLENPDPNCLNMSLADVHHKGVFSLVISGNEHGELTRVFIANRKIKPYEVQLHTHRYPVEITVIKGSVRQHTAFENTVAYDGVVLSEFDYLSPLNGGSGLTYVKEAFYLLDDFALPIGGTVSMDETEFHTMSCSKGSIWIVREGGFRTDKSKVLGVPFTTTGLYNTPKQFEINDNCQQVAKEVRKLVNAYKEN